MEFVRCYLNVQAGAFQILLMYLKARTFEAKCQNGGRESSIILVRLHHGHVTNT